MPRGRRPPVFSFHLSTSLAPSRLVWLPSDGTPGMAVPIPSIALHAISTDRDGPPAVVALLDDGEGGSDGGDCDDDDDAPPSAPELRFVPHDPPSSSSSPTADAIFAALCECAALNPDPALAAEGADGAGDWLTDADAVAAAVASGGGADPLASLPVDALDALLASQAARFADADG